MKALRFFDRRDLRLEECPIPEPGDDDVLIRVTDAGLSQTQINEFIEGPFIINRDPHPLTGIGMPLIPCQEYGGIVEKVGANVDKAWIGEQVAALPLISCGQCEDCRSGNENLCGQLGYYGLLGGHGGFAEYSVLPQSSIAPVSERDRLTFIEPILISLHAGLRALGPLKGQEVLVLGAGAVGCAVAGVFQYYFGANACIYDVLKQRLERAEKIGLNAIDIQETSRSFDCVVDAAGQDSFSEQDGYTMALDLVKPGGYLLHMGTYFHPISITPSDWLIKQIACIPSFAYNRRCVEALADALSAIPIDFSPLITPTRLENVMEDGYYRAEFDKDSFTRLVVRFDQ